MLLKELNEICEADCIVVSHDADRHEWKVVRLFTDGTKQEFVISEKQMNNCVVDLLEYYVR